MPLKELEQYIIQNKHLPDVPTQRRNLKRWYGCVWDECCAAKKDRGTNAVCYWTAKQIVEQLENKIKNVKQWKIILIILFLIISLKIN